MKEPTDYDVTLRVVEDSKPGARTARLTELLATGIARLLHDRAAVDFGRDMSVHHDVETKHRPW